jgi:hypothetical protein
MNSPLPPPLGSSLAPRGARVRSAPAPHTRDALRAAFPSNLGDEVDALVSRLPNAPHPLLGTPVAPRPIVLRGEPLRIPYRVYFPASEAPRPRSPGEAKPLACIYSRHHDGHVRQAQVATLLADTDAFLVPFVVLLIGECVLEVVEAIAARRETLAEAQYRAFALENPECLELMRRRATSYWNAYYRRRFPEKERYLPLLLLRGLLESGSAG